MKPIEPDAEQAALPNEHDRAALVSEDSDCKSLERLIKVPLELGDLLRLAIGVASALSGVHQKGLVHRNVNTANILVDPDSGEVTLTGFGLASLRGQGSQPADPPGPTSGALAFIAPEQTGRMNRPVDARSDLYAFGVTLYQMLTGSLPFVAVEPMEWFHCHIAREAVPPHERNPHLPPVLSALVMKLLAKTAEERYQTAAGVESDLRRCLAQWETEGRIDEFSIGDRDTQHQLLIPQKLYGRSREVSALFAAFERIRDNKAPELVLVSGYSGIGKSAIVGELHKLLTPPRGLFAVGKFDQYKRDIPYATLAQAFRSLLRPLLGKCEAELEPWRDTLREALGADAGIAANVIPELELIIGMPPPAPELPPKDAQRRVQRVLGRFIGVFARREQPLVLYLDDLQWIDAATLDFVEDLLTTSPPRHLMLIGSYRDNEVHAGHSLIRKLDAIKAAGCALTEIKLAPLAREHLEQMIADALRCEPERATPLAQLVLDKTAGNPFFAHQFIASLAEEKMLAFDHDAARWSWDLERINTKCYTDNVVELMVGKLNRLPAETQQALQTLACIGNDAELVLMERISQRPGGELQKRLREATRAGLISCTASACRFIHDKVQEAAYSLIPDDARAQLHLRIGRSLVAYLPQGRLPEMIFEIVNQFNRGTSLIASQDEREKLAELNLIAAKRAKASSAYASALTYLSAGAALIREDSWERSQALAFAIELLRADCELWTGELTSADGHLTALAVRVADTIQRAAVASRRLDLYMMLGDHDRAVAVGLEYLRHVGINWENHPTQLEAFREYERFWTVLGTREIEDVIDLPLMNNPDSLATLDVLTALGPPSLHTDENLYWLTICRAVNLSLEHGNSDAAPAHYAALGLIAGDGFGQYGAGYRLGKMACDLTERRGLKRLGGKTYSIFALLVPWTRPLRESVNPARRAFEMSNEQGDPTFAAYACRKISPILLALGDPLDQVQREAEHGLEFARTVGFGFAADMIVPPLALVRTLRGETAKFGSLDVDTFTEHSFEARFTGHHVKALPYFYWVRKLQARFFAGDHTSAIDAAEKAGRCFLESASLSVMLLERAEYHLFAALTRAACCEPRGSDSYAKHREALLAHERQLRAWAENCPENFEDRAALVGAEIANVEGRPLEAMDLYERAIRAACANGFVQNEALSYELAASSYAARGFKDIARLYLKNARQAYLRWGADGKVRQLEQLHPWLRQNDRATRAADMINAPVDILDLATVIKVSQAVSGEIVPEKLIETLMRIAIEHAGADRGVLILHRGDEFVIQAEAKTSVNGVTVRLSSTPMSGSALPESVVRYAARTRESVILDGPSIGKPPFTDEYIGAQSVRSILCLPLLKQRTLVALLYLENRLTPDVFTPDRIGVLKVLASQAAISLENSSLYRELQKRESQVRRLVEANIVGIVIWDVKGRILEANDAFLRIVGYQREDLEWGRLWWTDLTPAESLAQELERNQPQLELSGIVQPFEKEYVHKDGHRVPVLVGVAAFDDERTRGVGFVVDMTERKRAEEELRRSRQYLAEAQNVSHTGSWAWCPATNALLYLSEECYRILGYDPTQGIPSLASTVGRIHPEDRPVFVAKLKRYVGDGTEFEVECRLLLPDRTRPHVRILAHPVSDQAGAVVEYIGTVIDITEQKRAGQEREEHLWFLECMDRINRAMQHTNEVEGMTRGVLEEALAIFDCDRAWLAYPCDPDAQTCRAVMEHTHPDYPGLFALDKELPIDTLAAQFLRDMLQAPGAVVDPPGLPLETREQYNIQSMIVAVVRPKGDRPYLFGLHQCSRTRTWTCVERRLFEEIARRLNDTLTSALAHRNLLTSEEALRTSEERFRTLVDHATDAIFLYDQDGNVLDVNRQACEGLGYTRKELLGMRVSDFDHDITPERIDWIRRQLQEVGSVTFNGRRWRKDGSVFPVEVRARAFIRGGRLYAIALASDITDRRRREQRLLAEFGITQALSAAVSIEEAAPHILREMCNALEWDCGVLWRVDADTGVQVHVKSWFSPTLARSDSAAATGRFGTGLAARVWSRSAPVCIPDIALDEELPRTETATKEGLHAAFAFPIMLKSRVVGVVEFFSREVRVTCPELLQMMSAVGYQVGQFIERTRAEDALRNARERLAQASRTATVAELSASMAHEINQPLQAVVANAQACRRWLAATPPAIDKALHSVEAVVRDGIATADVISRIRALFKRTAPAKVDLDVNKLIIEVCKLMGDDFHGNSISLDTRLEPDVPTIRADAVQIQQVIVNLVRNGIEAMSAVADHRKSLWVRSRLCGNSLVVDVQDEGVGLTSLDSIFEPFVTTKETGMGMGLAICRSIIEAHAGRIWAVRNEDRGATFSFSLPTEDTGST